jgi:Na+/H+ antiporter NhaC
MYSVPLYYTAVRQMSASFAGAHLIPNAVCSMVGSLASGVYVRHTGKYYWLNFWSGVVGIVSAWLMYTWDVDTPRCVGYFVRQVRTDS